MSEQPPQDPTQRYKEIALGMFTGALASFAAQYAYDWFEGRRRYAEADQEDDDE